MRGRPRRSVAAILAVAGIALGLPAAAVAQQAGKKYALLIGINRYVNVAGQRIVPLRYAVRDVEELEKELEKQGYEVVTRSNDRAERRDIVTYLYYFAGIVQPQDTFLLYFAGHGVRNKAFNDETYWLAHSAQLGVLDEAGIRLDHLFDYLRDIKAHQKILLLDHCFSGDTELSAVTGASPESLDSSRSAGGAESAGERASEGTDVQLVRGIFPAEVDELKRQLAVRSQGIVVIGAAREQAMESERQQHGVFTAAFLAALRSRKADTTGDGQLSISELLQFLPGRMKEICQQEGLPEQSLKELVSGTDTASWILAPALPIDDVQEAKVKHRLYMDTIIRWEQQRWISFENKIRSRRLLDLWLAAVQEMTAPLSVLEKQLIGEIRQHIDTGGAEETRAEDLDETLNRLCNDGSGRDPCLTDS